MVDLLSRKSLLLRMRTKSAFLRGRGAKPNHVQAPGLFVVWKRLGGQKFLFLSYRGREPFFFFVGVDPAFTLVARKSEESKAVLFVFHFFYAHIESLFVAAQHGSRSICA